MQYLRHSELTKDESGNITGFVRPDGSQQALYAPEVSPVVTQAATATAHTGACEFRGIKLRAVSGTVNLTVYDNTSATGTPIHTIAGGAVSGGPDGNGYYPVAVGFAARLNTLGVHVVLSGGGTATWDCYVQGV
jgi:hypothetical protein